MINAYWEALDFDLPPMPAGTLAGWSRWIDTARESPEDITDAFAAPLVPGTQYRVAPSSVAVLFARIADTSVPEERPSATQMATQIDVPVNQPR
jgi:isoamylase